MKLLPLLCLPFLLSPALAQDQPPPNDETPLSYTTIKTMSISALSNGVQIRIAADGLLQFQRLYSEDSDGKKLQILFPGAKNGDRFLPRKKPWQHRHGACSEFQHKGRRNRYRERLFYGHFLF